MDLVGYDKYLKGELVDNELSQAVLDEAGELIKDLPKPTVAKSGKW